MAGQAEELIILCGQLISTPSPAAGDSAMPHLDPGRPQPRFVGDLDQAIAGPEFLADPYPVYAHLRMSRPVYRAQVGAWLLSRHADVTRVLHEYASFSSDGARSEETHRAPGPLDRTLGRAMMAADPPAHTRMRMLTRKAFTRRRIAVHEQVEAIVSALLDDISEAGAMDLMRDFANPLPFMVICEVLGIPDNYRQQLREWTRGLGDGSRSLRARGKLEPEELECMDAAAEALHDFMAGMVRARRERPGNDLVTDLLRLCADDHGMSDDELVGTCLLLLIAGHDTVASLIGNGTLALLRNPRQWELLKSSPERVERAVEELLRYDSPTQMVGRTVVEDVEVGGSMLRRGDFVLALTGAANRDLECFSNPDQLDITRDAREHLSFGVAPHVCLGGTLARLEARTAFRALAERFPRLVLATDAPRWRPWHAVATPLGLSFGLRGLEELPLTW
jgi:pimeloyl-[acyl-carrier protein] synthase